MSQRGMHARWLIPALIVAVAACSGPSAPTPQAGAPQPVAAAHDPWPAFAARYIEDYFRANPFFAAQAGRHEYDGRMADWSAAGIAAEVARLQKLRAQAAAFEAGALSAD